jgi:hypothetical protein
MGIKRDVERMDEKRSPNEHVRISSESPVGKGMGRNGCEIGKGREGKSVLLCGRVAPLLSGTCVLFEMKKWGNEKNGEMEKEKCFLLFYLLLVGKTSK